MPGSEIAACLARRAGERGLVLDGSQRAAIGQLQRLHDELLRPILPARMLRRVFKPKPVRGLYLWGAVGRGKSFMMDAFFSCVPLQHKKRYHFHHFMQEVHARLASMKGQADPLARLAEEFSPQVRLLCLDEFHIEDISDAMLMRGLLQGLLDRGMALVITSNAEPDGLYLNGLQRNRFLPGIDLLKSRLEVVRLDGGEDYRLAMQEQDGVYYSPLNAASEQALGEIFQKLAGNDGQANAGLQVEGRVVRVRRLGPGVAWFDFSELCRGPRSKADYIELAGRFHTLLLSGVPQFDSHANAEARRFVWLVDEFYDRRIRLILSAAVPLAQLGQAALLGGDFGRALSRLAEMQSYAYVASPPRSG